MSEEYIKKSDAIAGFESWKSEKNSAEENFFLCGAKEVIQSIPAADVVSAEAYKQIMWERDMAIALADNLREIAEMYLEEQK